MVAMKTKKGIVGIFVDMEKGVKQILEMLCSMKNVTRREYVTTCIEESIISDLGGNDAFREGLIELNPKLGEAFTKLEKRVAWRNSAPTPQIQEDQEDEEENEGEYDDAFDLPQEVAGS